MLWLQKLVVKHMPHREQGYITGYDMSSNEGIGEVYEPQAGNLLRFPESYEYYVPGRRQAGDCIINWGAWVWGR